MEESPTKSRDIIRPLIVAIGIAIAGLLIGGGFAKSREDRFVTVKGISERDVSADLAIWRTDGLEFGGAEDLVANLVFSGPHRVDRLVVAGVDVVRGGSLVRADEQEIAREHRKQAGRLWQ